ncbi:DUF2298 domain-containing protein [Salinibius halmophilus]|uniref:DUF2298 domain-containing protein n=1 Tax=Salinibius halmophilus TaxID=1853216 RepID=UPI000E6718FD|nr:DUF2298 domain-containing protein [Salinibius halmophilus]
MLHIYNFFIIALILINLAGLTAAAGKWLPHYAIARAGAVLIISMVLFFIEHFVGFGDISWAWPLTTVAALYVLYRRRNTLWRTGFHWAEVAFFMGFAYSMWWRYMYPDINIQSERITDLYFINNYMDGAQLPPEDKWHYPYNFDFYYAFMHYAAAFMGRLFGLDGGYTYNIAYSLIQASTIALAWHFSKVMLVKADATAGKWLLSMASTLKLPMNEHPPQRHSALKILLSVLKVLLINIPVWFKTRWKPLLLTLVMVFGGTGISPFITVMVNKDGIHNADYWYRNAILTTSATRFIGNFESSWMRPDDPREIRKPITDVFMPELDDETAQAVRDGEVGMFKKTILWLIHPQMSWQGDVPENWQAREMPSEIFSYQYYVGDYHPPLAGFFLVLILLACIAVLEREPNNRPAQALMALTVPAILLSNTWVLPLHGIICVAWAIYRHWRRIPPDWPVLLGAGLIGFVLIQPFMTHFADRSLSTPFRIVAEMDRTPANKLLMLFWPLLVLGVVGWFDKTNRKLYITMSVTIFFLIAITEGIYVDDPTGGKHVRTNSTMKWWGYLWVAAILMLGALGLASKKKWMQGVTTVVLLALMTYAPTMLIVALNGQKPSMGHLHGHQWLDRDATNRDKIAFMQNLPKGVVLESADKNAYSMSGVMSLFSNQPLAYGWYNHYLTWYGGGTHLGIKFEDTKKFYRGEMEAPLNWLRSRGIEYISWMPRDTNRVQPSPWAKVYDQIKDEFYWQPFYEQGQNRVGVFVRKPQ